MGINWGDIGSNITNFGGKVGETLISPSPIVKLVTNPQKVLDTPTYLLPDTIREIGGGGPARPVEEQWQEVGEDYANRVKKNVDILVSPNPVIQTLTGNQDDIISDKSAAEKWGNVTSSVDKKVVTPVKETVKETVNNVTKGVGEALPVIAIGGAAILVVSLLLGRR